MWLFNNKVDINVILTEEFYIEIDNNRERKGES